jgi:hypothetical protein
MTTTRLGASSRPDRPASPLERRARRFGTLRRRYARIAFPSCLTSPDPTDWLAAGSDCASLSSRRGSTSVKVDPCAATCAPVGDQRKRDGMVVSTAAEPVGTIGEAGLEPTTARAANLRIRVAAGSRSGPEPSGSVRDTPSRTALRLTGVRELSSVLPSAPKGTLSQLPQAPQAAVELALHGPRTPKPRRPYRGPGWFDLRSNGGANRDRTGDLLLAN